MTEQLSRRRFLQLSAVGASVGILSAVSACTPAAGPQSTSDGVSAATTEIIHWGRNPTEEEVVWKQLLPIAQEMFPELTITFQAPPENMTEKLLVAFAGGTAPDTSVGGLSSFRGWIGIDMINPIQDYVDGDADVQSWLPDYVPAAIQGYSLEGSLYGVPTVSEGILLWYNKDAIEEAGLTPPAEIQNDPTKWNWDTVLEYARALNIGEGFRRERYGIIATSARTPSGFSESWGNLTYARDGRFLDEAGEEFLFDSPEVAEAVQWVVDLTHKHDVQPNPGEMSAADVLDRAMFQNGQLGMVMQGEYFRRYLWGSGKPSEGLPFNYDLALMPYCPATDKRTNVYHGNGSFMTTQADQPDEAWKWLKVIFTQEAQQIITLNWGSRGANTKTYEEFMATNAGGGPDGLNYQAFNDADQDTVPYPTTRYLTRDALMEPTVRIMYDNVFLGTMPVEEGLVQIKEETVALLDRARDEYNARQ